MEVNAEHMSRLTETELIDLCVKDGMFASPDDIANHPAFDHAASRDGRGKKPVPLRLQILAHYLIANGANIVR